MNTEQNAINELFSRHGFRIIDTSENGECQAWYKETETGYIIVSGEDSLSLPDQYDNFYSITMVKKNA